MRAAPLIVAGAIVFGLSPASHAHAGDRNTIHIKQESPAGSLTGNSLSIDQSDASDSLVAGPSLSTLLPFAGLSLDSAFEGAQRPALQRGEGNEATVKMRGNDGVLLLLQDTSPGRSLQTAGSPTSNVARVDMTGNSLGAVIQMGTGNEAALNLTDATGLIGQFGTNLAASLTVGAGSSGQIVQIGNNNDVAMQVSGGGAATYTQIGNNLTPLPDGNGNPVQIFTTNNIGTVTITQTGF